MIDGSLIQGDEEIYFVADGKDGLIFYPYLIIIVPVPDLPVAAVAPKYMEQKATIDAVFALALGLYTYVNPVPTVTGAPNLVQLLTQDCKNITGGIMNVERDPTQAADAILAHIELNRKKLDI